MRTSTLRGGGQRHFRLTPDELLQVIIFFFELRHHFTQFLLGGGNFIHPIHPHHEFPGADSEARENSSGGNQNRQSGMRAVQQGLRRRDLSKRHRGPQSLGEHYIRSERSSHTLYFSEYG